MAGFGGFTGIPDLQGILGKVAGMPGQGGSYRQPTLEEKKAMSGRRVWPEKSADNTWLVPNDESTFFFDQPHSSGTNVEGGYYLKDSARKAILNNQTEEVDNPYRKLGLGGPATMGGTKKFGDTTQPIWTGPPKIPGIGGPRGGTVRTQPVPGPGGFLGGSTLGRGVPGRNIPGVIDFTQPQDVASRSPRFYWR